MKVLVAEDDSAARRILEVALTKWDYEVVPAQDGTAALEVLRCDDSPRLAVLDWMMPGTDGVEICRELRKQERAGYVYVILLTAKGRSEDIQAGLDAGADDYMTKPCNLHELRCRVRAGERILDLETVLEGKLHELETALTHVKELQGLLPICMYCKKIRDEEDTWHGLESYIQKHSKAEFTHSLCQECMKERLAEELGA